MHGFANPTRFLSIARPLTPAFMLTGVIMVAIALFLGLFTAPADRLMGETVRILYIHVPAAWLGMAGLDQHRHRQPGRTGLAAPAGRNRRARICRCPAHSSALLCLATGSIWARPTWGTWWVWDGRLTSMLVLFFLYLGYIALADASQKDAAAGRTGTGRVAAIFGLVGAINVPIINRSVVWWNSLHQPASISMGKSAIDPAFLWPWAWR